MQLKKPDAISFSKSNSIHPFEDSTSLAFWSKKNDASLFAVGMHSKKRPNNLVLARTFDNEVMDMMELGVEQAVSVKDAKVSSSAHISVSPHSYGTNVSDRHILHFLDDTYSQQLATHQVKDRYSTSLANCLKHIPCTSSSNLSFWTFTTVKR